MLEKVITTSDIMVKKNPLKGYTIFNLSEEGSRFLRGVRSRGHCHYQKRRYKPFNQDKRTN